MISSHPHLSPLSLTLAVSLSSTLSPSPSPPPQDELLQPIFSVGLKGVAEEDLGKVELLVEQVLAEIAEEGFTANAVEAAVNTVEFGLRENNTGSFPRGLSLMLRSVVGGCCRDAISGGWLLQGCDQWWVTAAGMRSVVGDCCRGAISGG